MLKRRKNVLILEDDEERTSLFKAAVAGLGNEFELHLWPDAPSMIAECLSLLPDCCLISLDHDLNPLPGATQDPGTGLDVVEFLVRQNTVRPVIIHTSNTERRWSMHNEFRFAKWHTEIVAPFGKDWIPYSWLPKAKWLIGQ
jgi:hypothetical protein